MNFKCFLCTWHRHWNLLMIWDVQWPRTRYSGSVFWSRWYVLLIAALYLPTTSSLVRAPIPCLSCWNRPFTSFSHYSSLDFSLMPCKLLRYGFSNCGPQTSIIALPGNLFEIQILEPHLGVNYSRRVSYSRRNFGFGPQQFCFNKQVMSNVRTTTVCKGQFWAYHLFVQYRLLPSLSTDNQVSMYL